MKRGLPGVSRLQLKELWLQGSKVGDMIGCNLPRGMPNLPSCSFTCRSQGYQGHISPYVESLEVRPLAKCPKVQLMWVDRASDTSGPKAAPWLVDVETLASNFAAGLSGLLDPGSASVARHAHAREPSPFSPSVRGGHLPGHLPRAPSSEH